MPQCVDILTCRLINPSYRTKYVYWAAPSLAFGSYEGVVCETATENVRACKGTKKRATKNCNLFCNIAENELNSDVARFTTYIKVEATLLNTHSAGPPT